MCDHTVATTCLPVPHPLKACTIFLHEKCITLACLARLLRGALAQPPKVEVVARKAV